MCQYYGTYTCGLCLECTSWQTKLPKGLGFRDDNPEMDDDDAEEADENVDWD